MKYSDNKITYIYQYLPVEHKTLYFNGTGWTEGRSNARLYTPADAEPMVRRMMLEHVHAKTGDIRNIR